MLYVVATPIGNLSDITFRAVEVLKSVDLIACEDTRHSKILLDHYGIHKPLVSLFLGQEKEKTAKVLHELESGKNVALISDAGTPNIQDPGFLLVRACREKGIDVAAVPGPCAAIAALSISGLPTDSFVFEGFLSVKNGPRKKKMLSWKDEARTVIFYVSPYKVVKTLSELQEVLGDVEVVVARELTKKFEEVLRKPLSGMLAHFNSHPPKGEFVVLFRLPRI